MGRSLHRELYERRNYHDGKIQHLLRGNGEITKAVAFSQRSLHTITEAFDRHCRLTITETQQTDQIVTRKSLSWWFPSHTLVCHRASVHTDLTWRMSLLSLPNTFGTNYIRRHCKTSVPTHEKLTLRFVASHPCSVRRGSRVGPALRGRRNPLIDVHRDLETTHESRQPRQQRDLRCNLLHTSPLIVQATPRPLLGRQRWVSPESKSALFQKDRTCSRYFWSACRNSPSASQCFISASIDILSFLPAVVMPSHCSLFASRLGPTPGTHFKFSLSMFAME